MIRGVFVIATIIVLKQDLQDFLDAQDWI